MGQRHTSLHGPLPQEEGDLVTPALDAPGPSPSSGPYLEGRKGPFSRRLSIRNISIRRSLQRARKSHSTRPESGETGTTPRAPDSLVMDRLRKSLRNSFRRRKERVPESVKPHQWQSDEVAVKNGTCCFPVKYLGCVEVFDSRGMHVCEDALRRLRNSRRRPVKGTLLVTGDGLRVVDSETKGLLLDQTIEKVSFCAPDRGHERGFSYICRDGTTRRWMCHGFHAAKDSGERLSHAVGCAFAVCLERKQRRDKEAVKSVFDVATATFTRTGSFRQSSITERMHDPQVAKASEPPPVRPVHNPYAVERPHAAPGLLQRQGSLRGGPLHHASPFKRQLSLRLGLHSLAPQSADKQSCDSLDTGQDTQPALEESHKPPEQTDQPDQPGQSALITAMCQQLSQGLSMLASKSEEEAQSPPPAHSDPSPFSAFDKWIPQPLSSDAKSQPTGHAPNKPTPLVPPSVVDRMPEVNAPSPPDSPLVFGPSTSLPSAGDPCAATPPIDPFDAGWAEVGVTSGPVQANSTNPFLSCEPEVSCPPFKAFEVSM